MARGKADIKTRLKRQEEKILKMSEQLEKGKRNIQTPSGRRATGSSEEDHGSVSEK